MDTEKQYTKKCKPEIGRGCSFCDCGAECEAKLCDGCFKLHETAWLEEYPENIPTDIVEVRFKNTRRSFYQNANNLQLKRGDIVAVEASPGHDIGVVSLTGDLVARQMRRTGFNPYNGEFKKVYRKAKPYDIEKWQEAIALEHETMIASRQIAADMGLNMKIGDVEYQGDKIKAIFYYIADERVDFRELIKVFAERFHIRIEMKQIGARQEAGRIGGLGACGRELCCASWMSSFSSVTTGAARAQEISLNPQKLAGQCSKLKCCMMYEYDTYVDARKEFPRLREPLQAIDGEYFLVKSDILAGTMTFSSSKDAMVNVTTLPVSRVREIMALNRAGKKVDQLQHADDIRPIAEEPTYRSEEDSITRFDSAKRRNKRGRNRGKQNGQEGQNGQPSQETGQERRQAQPGQQPQQERPERRQRRSDRSRNGENRNGEGRSNENRNNGEGRNGGDRRFGDRKAGQNASKPAFRKENSKPASYPKYDPAKQTGEMRLNRFLAQSGICSRREADDFITAGLVSVNGQIVTELGTKVLPTDEVKFNDSRVQGEKKVYLVLNKPKGYVTSLDDPHAGKTVMELVKGACTERIYPVGRLDKNSLGLLLFTNDGDLTKQLTHPSYRKKKIYQVTLDKPLTRADMDRIAEGITLEDGEIFADEISYVKENKQEVGIEIHSGRNRIVRRIFEFLGYTVTKLDRVYYAGLTKKNLKRGAWRFLSREEVERLKSGQYE